MKKIYYIMNYCDSGYKKARLTPPSSNVVADYIAEAMHDELGYDVEILSLYPGGNRHGILNVDKGYTVQCDNFSIRYFTALTSNVRFINNICYRISTTFIKRYLKKHCFDSDARIIVYHLLGIEWVLDYIKSNNGKFIYQFNDFFADYTHNEAFRPIEYRCAEKADAFIFASEGLRDLIDVGSRPSVICYGTYHTYPVKDKKYREEHPQKYIHCVFAGSANPERGVTRAILAAEYLPENYRIHIQTFGLKEPVNNVINLIEEVNQRSKAKVILHGVLTGEEEMRFIRSCDIGLNTLDPQDSFHATSFPSKILTYLSNGLRVVSIKTPILEKSAINDLMFYYDKDSPEDIAAAIQSVNISDDYDASGALCTLDKDFKNELRRILE